MARIPSGVFIELFAVAAKIAATVDFVDTHTVVVYIVDTHTAVVCNITSG